MSPKADAMLAPSLPREEPITPIPGRPDTFVTIPAKAISAEMQAVQESGRPPSPEAWRKALEAELAALKAQDLRRSKGDEVQDLTIAALSARLTLLDSKVGGLEPNNTKAAEKGEANGKKLVAVLVTVIVTAALNHFFPREPSPQLQHSAPSHEVSK